jgi:hypothetical protein
VKKSLAFIGFAMLTVLIGLVPPASVGAASRPSSYTLPGDAVFPEGVAYQPTTGNFFVSSTTDGSVLRGNVMDSAATPFIAGGVTGEVRVYDAATGTPIRTFTTGAGGFLNDIAVAKNGDLFVTDSFRPVLWRIPAAEIEPGAPEAAEAWLDLTRTIPYIAGQFNVNGIVAIENGRHLVVSQSFTSELFRIDVATKALSEIDLGGQAVAGDGLALLGRILYAGEPFLHQIAKVSLSGDLSTGTVLSRTTDPSFLPPTTVAVASGRLLVVNSQFERLFGGLPPILPFTISSIPLP